MSAEVYKAAVDKNQDTKKKKNNPYREYLNLETAKSQLSKHSPNTRLELLLPCTSGP